MLCHQHTADSAHAACQRCQRGLCRSCTKLFLQRLCTHCIEQSTSQRTRDARRTLWLALPVFALVTWATAMGLSATSPRVRLYFALLAGTSALGAWLGLRRWRRAPALASGSARLPESETPFLERLVVPALAGLAFWPWLLFETLLDMKLANRLRAFVPAPHRASSFGLGEASLAFASLASAFTLGTHGLSGYTPVAGKLWSTEASLAASAQEAVRARLTKAAPAGASEPSLPVVHASEASRAEPALPSGAESPPDTNPAAKEAAEPNAAQDRPAAAAPTYQPPALPAVPHASAEE